MSFNEISPIGGIRGDLHAAIVACTMANAWAGKGKSYKLADFLLKFGADSTPTQKELDVKVSQLEQWGRMHNKLVETAKKKRTTKK